MENGGGLVWVVANDEEEEEVELWVGVGKVAKLS